MALPGFFGLDDKPLENWFDDFFRNNLRFDNYFPSAGQIPLNTLNPAYEKGHHLEIDGILRIHKTCILFEYTAQKGAFRDKLKKFLRNCQLFGEDRHLSLKKKFELFGIPASAMDDFEDIEKWKYVYFGTHPDFDLRTYGRGDFPEYPNIAKDLYILRPTQLEYLRQLTNSIGNFGKNELLALLDLSPSDLGEIEESFVMDYIKADGKYIAGNSEVKADIYLLKFKISQLLKIAKVSRFEGLPFVMEKSSANENYQRLLIEDKLNSIAEKFINGNKKKTFPNTITLALSDECRENENGRLIIPKKYSSIDIIDGQHRLFGYTRPDVSDEIRDNAEILATAIKFRNNHDTEIQMINKCAARVFCEVNSTQAQVSQDLLYLIKFDVLGDRDYEAAAGKVLLECDKKENAVTGLFAVNTLRRNNHLNKPSISIINFIEQELVPFLKGEGIDEFIIPVEDFENLFGEIAYETDPREFINAAVRLLEEYFSYIKSTFSNDWKANADTILISENYILAFFRFLRYHLYNSGKSMKEMLTVLNELKVQLNQLTGITDKPCFPGNDLNFPSINASVTDIFHFLRSPAPSRGPI